MLGRKAHLLLIIPALLVVSSAAHAYTRSCNASYKIVAKYQNKTTVYPFTFRASAYSSGYIPTTLRKRAYRRARDCMNAAVDDDYGLPAQCTASYIHSYPARVFGYEAAEAACDQWRLSGTTITVKVYGEVWGDRGCGGSWSKRSTTFLIDGDYEFYCR